jgi:hypothetical protein
MHIKHVSTQCALEKNISNSRHNSQDGGSARHPPDPQWTPFSLMGWTHSAQALSILLSLIDVGECSAARSFPFPLFVCVPQSVMTISDQEKSQKTLSKVNLLALQPLPGIWR